MWQMCRHMGVYFCLSWHPRRIYNPHWWLRFSSRLPDDDHLLLTARIARIAQVPLFRRHFLGSVVEVTVPGRSPWEGLVEDLRSTRGLPLKKWQVALVSWD